MMDEEKGEGDWGIIFLKRRKLRRLQFYSSLGFDWVIGKGNTNLGRNRDGSESESGRWKMEEEKWGPLRPCEGYFTGGVCKNSEKRKKL